MKSISCNRIIANHTNAVRQAVITASAQRPSTDVRLLLDDRAGGGRVGVSGSYTGAADTDIDVEIVSGTGGALTSSTPLINGVGNGQLAIESIDPAALPETLTFSLLHAGDPADPAVLEFAGTTLAARTPGAAGNAISVTVTRDLVATSGQYSTLDPITAGSADFDGPEWDWGQPPATDSGIPASALRVQFEGFPTVHRSWKTWESGRFIYRIDPAPAWDIPADTRILSVTGDYPLTISDGVVDEVYVAITVHDFLAAVSSRSELVDVVGVVAQDRAPGGMAITDIPLRTDAHTLPVKLSVRSSLVRGLDAVSVAPTAPTENITIEHVGRGAGGADVWSVRGSVSGNLAQAQTGIPYADGPVQFTVPAIVVPGAQRARISAVVSLVDREEGEGIPAVCFKPLRLGLLASDKSVTYTYRKRPPADCVCEQMPALKLSAKCLGLDTGGTEMALDAEYQTRLQELYEWRAEFLTSNVGFETGAGNGILRADAVDIELADDVTSELAVGLSEIYQNAAARGQWDTYFAAIQTALSSYNGLDGVGGVYGITAAPWQPLATVSAGQYLRPTAAAGLLIYVTASGVLSDTEPDWGSETNPVTDGTATLELLAPYWEASQVVTEGKIIQPGNGYRYRATNSDTTDTTEPYWPEGAGTVTDGGVVWERVTSAGAAIVVPGAFQVVKFGGKELHEGWFVQTGAIIQDGVYLKALSGYGTTAQDAGLALDGFAALSLSALNARRNGDASSFVQTVGARMDHVRTIAGIVPKSSASTAAGDGCWRDYPEEAYWWVDESGEYLPAFNNRPYVSASRDAEGAIYSTKEFGFGIVTPCVDRLKEGDRFTVTIRGTVNAYTYTEGDKFTLPVIAAQALAFTGGTDGDPTQTWTVRGTLSNALPDWLFNPSAPAPYDDAAAPVVASLAPGGIPFEQGDTIRVALEGGVLRWRRDGGAWTLGDLFGAAHDLGDGLALTATAGAAPSFIAGDAWQFRALATYGVSRVRQPRVGQAFAFDADGAVLDIDFGAVVPMEAVLLALHTLPATAALDISGGDTDTSDWSVTPAVRPGAILSQLPSGTTARYLRVAIFGTVSGASLGWVWAGVGWQPSVGATDITIARQYGIARGAGLNPSGLYRGRGNGGRWAWDVSAGSALLDSNIDELMTLVDHVVEQGLEPVCITPDIRDPARASIAILDADEISLGEHNNWQGAARAVSVELPFKAVLA